MLHKLQLCITNQTLSAARHNWFHFRNDSPKGQEIKTLFLEASINTADKFDNKYNDALLGRK